MWCCGVLQGLKVSQSEGERERGRKRDPKTRPNHNRESNDEHRKPLRNHWKNIKNLSETGAHQEHPGAHQKHPEQTRCAQKRHKAKKY